MNLNNLIPRKNKSSVGKQNEKNNYYTRFSLETSKKHKDSQVPEIIFKITERLDQNLCTESLYRKPGNKENILKLLKKQPDKIRFEKEDVHDLASLLKMILTEMEKPLLPKQIFEAFKVTANQTEIKEKLKELDPIRKETLDHVMQHILRVIDKEDVNKMSKENICVVWAPVVYYPLENHSDAEKCIEFFAILMGAYMEENRKTEKVEGSKQEEKEKIEVTSADTGKKVAHNIKFASMVKEMVQKKREDLKDKIESIKNTNEVPRGLSFRKYCDLETHAEGSDGNSKTAIEMFKKEKQVESSKRKYKRKAPQPQVIHKEPTLDVKLTTEENNKESTGPTEELVAEENGDERVIEEKQGKETEKNSAENDKSLTQEEKRKDSGGHHEILVLDEEGHDRRLAPEDEEEEKESAGHNIYTQLPQEDESNKSETSQKTEELNNSCK